MSSRTLEERKQKLKELQKKKSNASRKNREELFKEYRIQSIGENKLRRLEQKQIRAQIELNKLDSKEKGEDYERKKCWDYSIEDHERWEKIQEEKDGNVNNAGFVNYSQLAEQAYKKEISQLDIDKKDYKKQKEKLKEQKTKKITSDESAIDHVIQGEKVDYTNKPSKEAINRLVRNLKHSDLRKMKRRKDYEDTDTYINDKNKQFNEKLNRHYDKYT